MKKFISLILAAAMLFSFAFAEENEAEAIYAQAVQYIVDENYPSGIELLQSGDAGLGGSRAESWLLL